MAEDWRKFEAEAQQMREAQMINAGEEGHGVERYDTADATS